MFYEADMCVRTFHKHALMKLFFFFFINKVDAGDLNFVLYGEIKYDIAAIFLSTTTLL